MNKRNSISAILLTSVGWGISWGIGWAVSSALAYFGIQVTLSSPLMFYVGLAVLASVVATSGICWIIGGSSTGLILWRRYPAFRWKHTLLVACGWLVSGGIGFPVLFVIVFGAGFVVGLGIGAFLWGDSFVLNVLATALFFFICLFSFLVSWLLSGAIVGAIGSLITGLTLRWSRPSIEWRQAILIVVTWGIGLSLAWFIGWAISGLIWGTFWGNGEDILVSDVSHAIVGAIRAGIGGAVGGMVGGILGGGIGSTMIFGQLNRAQGEQRGSPAVQG